MGAAAGAAVGPGEAGDAHLAGELLFAPVGEGGQLLGAGIEGLKGVVFPEVAVGPGLDVQHPLPGDVGVVVNDNRLLAQVEAGVVAVIGGAEHPADDMLSGVLLHMVKAAGPVDFPVDGLPLGQSPVAGVENHPVPLVDIGDLGTA